MALENIPVLDEDYPLFDWSDYPDSFAALVSGSLVSEFEKETWNAIIQKLSDALSSAGLSWDGTYTTADGAKITEEYGDLYAKAFNSVRHNINLPVPLGWAWSDDKSFRGYVSRKDFRGVDQYGESGADDVYPEYIIELVRRLNLLLGIMRGDGPIGDMSAIELSETLSDVTLRLGEILEISGGRDTSCSDGEARVRTGMAARIRADSELIETDHDVTCIAGKTAHVCPASSLHKTKSNVAVHVAEGKPITPEKSKIFSLYEALVLSGIPIDMYVTGRTASNHKAKTHTVPGASIKGEGTAATTASAAIGTAASETISARGQSASKGRSAIDFAGATQAKARGKAKSTSSCAVISQAPMPPPRGMAASLCSAVLGTAWYPPKWVNGGLWIRQSHNVTQNENGELVIT